MPPEFQTEPRIEPAVPGRGGRAGPTLLVATGIALCVHLYGLYRPVGPPTPPWLPLADKVEHLIGFALPVLLVLLTLDRSGGASPRRRVQLIVVLLFAAHAVVSEIVQHFYYVHRTGDPLDVLADWVGVGLGWLAYWLIRRAGAERA
jgi:hypothetical protein